MGGEGVYNLSNSDSHDEHQREIYSCELLHYFFFTPVIANFLLLEFEGGKLL